MNDTRLALLKQISKCLNEYGIESEIRNDREDGIYINIGNVRRKSQRAQFWVEEETGIVKVWVGLDMSRMYMAAVSSPYLAEWDTEKNHEIHLIFPYLFPAMNFIKDAAHQ